MDIEQAKKDWELNRLKNARDEEERRAELDEDDMLYTYSKEDGMNQVQKSVKKQPKQPYQRKRAVPEASRKSNRPPRPKQLDSDSDEDMMEPARKLRKPGKPGVGRPKGSKNKKSLDGTQESLETRTIKLKSMTSAKDEVVTVKRIPGGGKTYIVSSPITSSPLIRHNTVSRINGRAGQTPISDDSDVDVEGGVSARRSSRHRSGSASPIKAIK